MKWTPSLNVRPGLQFLFGDISRSNVAAYAVLRRDISNPFASGQKMDAEVLWTIHIATPGYFPKPAPPSSNILSITEREHVIHVIGRDDLVRSTHIHRTSLIRFSHERAGTRIHALKHRRFAAKFSEKQAGVRIPEGIEWPMLRGQGPQAAVLGAPDALSRCVSDHDLNFSGLYQLTVHHVVPPM